MLHTLRALRPAELRVGCHSERSQPRLQAPALLWHRSRRREGQSSPALRRVLLCLLRLSLTQRTVTIGKKPAQNGRLQPAGAEFTLAGGLHQTISLPTPVTHGSCNCAQDWSCWDVRRAAEVQEGYSVCALAERGQRSGKEGRRSTAAVPMRAAREAERSRAAGREQGLTAARTRASAAGASGHPLGGAPLLKV